MCQCSPRRINKDENLTLSALADMSVHNLRFRVLWLLRKFLHGVVVADIRDLVNTKRFFMVCCIKLPVIWARGAMVALAGLSGMVLVPSLSLAQYPGSAGDLNTGAFGASSSASSGSSGGSAGSSAASSSGVNSDESGLGSANGSMSGSGSYTGGADGRDDAGIATAAFKPKKAVRKRALIRQFRLEFAKTLTIETSSKLPLRALYADVYLDQFSKELDAGLDQQADVNSLGSDLGLLRNALDHRLNKVIASYDGEAPRRGFFYKTTSAGGSAPALRTEIQKLKLKHELLKFGEYSLQAMGYYAE